MRERGKETLLELLKEVRAEAGLKQAELARRLGVAQSFISKYESGERRLDLLEMHEVCHAVGIRLADFAKRLDTALTEKKTRSR